VSEWPITISGSDSDKTSPSCSAGSVTTSRGKFGSVVVIALHVHPLARQLAEMIQCVTRSAACFISDGAGPRDAWQTGQWPVLRRGQHELAGSGESSVIAATTLR